MISDNSVLSQGITASQVNKLNYGYMHEPPPISHPKMDNLPQDLLDEC